VQSATAIRGPR